MGFSMLEAAAILATVLPRFRFEPAGEEPTPVAQITLRPKTGMPMVLAAAPKRRHKRPRRV